MGICCYTAHRLFGVAISTILNHPTKRAAPPKAHSSLPSHPQADLPRVRRKDFDPYLRDIQQEWERFESSRTAPNDASTGAISLSSSLKLSNISSQKSLPALSYVPNVFFESPFDLGNPSTFALVTEQKEGSEFDPASITHSLPLLEKLSHYADTVEQHLIVEVQARSSSFFEALTNLNDLRAESQACLQRIAQLKESLKEVDEKQAKRGLEIVRMNDKLRKINDVKTGVSMLKELQDMKSFATGLVQAGEWSEALSMIENMQNLWEASKGTTQPQPQQQRPIGSSVLATVPESPVVTPATPTQPEQLPSAIVSPTFNLSSLQFASSPIPQASAGLAAKYRLLDYHCPSMLLYDVSNRLAVWR